MVRLPAENRRVVDRMTASGSALGLTLQDNTAMFREELNFATRMGTINRLDEKGRGRLLKQTGELRETQLKYTGALGVSLDVIRQFAFQMLESSSDFQSRLLLMKSKNLCHFCVSGLIGTMLRKSERSLTP